MAISLDDLMRWGRGIKRLNALGCARLVVEFFSRPALWGEAVPGERGPSVPTENFKSREKSGVLGFAAVVSPACLS
jgi:hypothetical protein